VTITLGIFLKITKIHSTNNWTTFFYGKGYLRIRFHKNGLGCMLGDFFTNASGHPGGEALSGHY
jgi:hypothetical protein